MDNLSTWPYFGGPGQTQIDEMNPVAKSESLDRQILRKGLNHKHMIETIERFKWIGLPPELPSDLIERILYFRFKGSLFYAAGRYLFLPFALKGKNSETIDSYGRYVNITPVLFTGQWKIGGDGKFTKDISFITNKSFAVVYDLPADQKENDAAGTGEVFKNIKPIKETDQVIEGEVKFDKETKMKDWEKKTVILTDSSLEISQDYTPISYLVYPFINRLTNILVLVDIDLINSAKVHTIVAKDAAQKDAIEAEFRGLDQKILNGIRVIVVTSATQLQELNKAVSKDSARYFQSYQSIDNLRKDMIGADNGGTFMKQEHTTEMETETNSNTNEDGSLVLQNALRMRQEFCAIVKKVFGLNIQVEIKSDSGKDSVAPKGSQSKEREGDEE